MKVGDLVRVKDERFMRIFDCDPGPAIIISESDSGNLVRIQFITDGPYYLKTKAMIKKWVEPIK